MSVCFLFPPSLATEVSRENCSYLNPLVNTMVNANYTKGIQSANILLTFRLVQIQNQRLEQQLTQQIQEDIKKRGECLYSTEELGKDLPIYKDDLQ